MIPVAKPDIGEEELNSVSEAVKSGWIAKGDKLDAFEKGIADYFGAKHALCTSSGTTALEVALRALMTRKKEVIMGVSSCASNVNAVLNAGFKCVFVDVEESTSNMDTSKIEECITDDTAAIVAIHLYGQSCDMEAIMAISKKYEIPVIEDCAQSMGSMQNGRLTGTFGSAAIFSFYSNKIITTGEGGCIITNDDNIADAIKTIRNHGQALGKHFVHTILGGNYKMTNIQAALGVAQLKKIDSFIEKRQKNAKLLSEKLSGIEGIKLPVIKDGNTSVFFSFPIVIEKEGARDLLCAHLEKMGIETRNMFDPMCDQPFYKDLFGKPDKEFPVADRIGKSGFYVSCSTTLSEEDITSIAESIKGGLDGI